MSELVVLFITISWGKKNIDSLGNSERIKFLNKPVMPCEVSRGF